MFEVYEEVHYEATEERAIQNRKPNVIVVDQRRERNLVFDPHISEVN